MRILSRLVAAGVLGIAAGCGGTPFVPVSGRVTLDGKPVEGATVLFQPKVSDPNAVAVGSIGKTGPDGGYTLAVIARGNDGAVAGTHHVTISAPIYPADGSVPDSLPDRIPDLYHRDGGVEFEVPPGGTKQADFPLETPKKSKPVRR